MQQREFDIVIWGATGFTGKLVAEHMVARLAGADSSVTWALGGRDEAKLRSVCEELNLPADMPLVVADATNAESMAALAQRARVVLTTVGPYQRYGNELLAACAENGTHYVDLCGEPNWMHAMIRAHAETAATSGACIVFSCGFDSVPFDLGVYYLQKIAVDNFGAPCARIRGRVRGMRGTFSGGTAASLQATLAAAAADPATIAVLKNPYSLTPDFIGPDQPSGSRPVYDEAFGSWAAPFVMAPINTKTIHRTNYLLSQQYGGGFLYDEMVLTGPGEKGEKAANAIASDKSLAGSDRKPGEGPSREERENGFYDLVFRGEGPNGQTLQVSVKADRDPGYGSTSKMISECALVLADDNGPAAAGIWTPAAVMGDTLLARLPEHAGIDFVTELD